MANMIMPVQAQPLSASRPSPWTNPERPMPLPVRGNRPRNSAKLSHSTSRRASVRRTFPQVSPSSRGLVAQTSCSDSESLTMRMLCTLVSGASTASGPVPSGIDCPSASSRSI